MTTRAPSVKTLCQLKDVTRETAKRIRLVIKLETRNELADYAERYLPRTRDWLMRCYHRPQASDLRAAMLDELLCTFGVEYLFATAEGLQGHCSLPSDELVCEFLNAGDTYATTLIRYHGRWQLGCWGDIAERYL